MNLRRDVRVGTAVLALAACGGSSGTGTNQTCTPGPTAAFTITSTGISPPNVCVQPGGQVTFTNNDTASTHDIEFDTSGCPTVGNVSSGAPVTAIFPTAVNCSFHDGRNPSSAAFKGTVAVTAVIVSGGGY